MEIKIIRLISKFIGWNTHVRMHYLIGKDVEEYDVMYLPEILGNINDGYIRIESAQFDKSWDWLMPVINKIYSMNEYVKYVEETSGQFENKVNINTMYINRTLLDVISFINWYNDNKPPNENQILGQSTII